MAVHGTFSVEIDVSGMKADLVIKSSPDAPEITVEAVGKELERKGVRSARSAADIGEVLARAATDGADRLTVCEGVPPENGRSESVEWEDIAVPPDFADVAEQILSAAQVPTFSIEKKKKITEKKPVTTKSRIPFVKPKTEMVDVVRTENVRESVYVDPSVQKTGFADEGAVIGTILPYSPGKPGKNVYGSAVQPVPPADPHFHLGPGIKKNGRDLVSVYAGFIRIGRNWADIVPYSRHDWRIIVSPDKASCSLAIEHGHEDAPVPDTAEVIDAARAAGCPIESLLEEDSIATVIRDAIGAGRTEHIPISKNQDSVIELEIGDDRLTAVLNLRKGRGTGRHLLLKEIGAAIRGAGLRNLDNDRIKEDITTFYASAETELVGYVLAEGTPPTRGTDQSIEYTVRFLDAERTEQHLASVASRGDLLREMTSLPVFPFDAVERVAFVEQDQRVAEITPATVGSPGVDVYGAVIPGIGGQELPLQLFEDIERTQNLLVSRRKGVLDLGTVDDRIALRVRPHEDACVNIVIAEDRMTAYIRITKDEGGGRPLSMDAVRAEIEKSGVTYGIRDDILESALEQARDDGEVNGVPFAFGEPAVGGDGRKFRWCIAYAPGRNVTIRPDGTADYKNAPRFTTVREGTEIAELLPSTGEPIPGTDVSGRAIPAPETPDDTIEAANHVEPRDEDDGRRVFIAECDGELAFNGKRMEIRPGHAVAGNVGAATGNIRFPGSVSVAGAVESGYFIVSGGEVRISDTIEAALVSAELDIAIAGGIQGGGKAVVRTKRGVVATFIEQATVLAVADVMVKNTILRCAIKCNGRVVVAGDRGGIVGGTVRARRGLDVASLGNSAGVKTTISFGQDYLIADRIESEQKEIEKLKGEIVSIDAALGRAGSDVKSFSELKTRKVKAMKMMEKRGSRVFLLREKFEQHFASEVKIRGTLYPGVVIESHGRYYEAASPKKKIEIVFDEQTGRLIDRPLA